MNVISYINGDEQITDFPVCSARPLACLVQSCNDLLAGPDGYLSPENSVLALELGWQTMGTAAVPNTVIHAWVAELLTNPDWGVVRYAKLTAMKAIIDIAELHRRLAAGDMAPIATWDAADRAARAAARGIGPATHAAGRYALQAAYESTALVDTRDEAALAAVAGNALRTYAWATGDTMENRVMRLTRRAVATWRELAGLDNARRIDQASVDNAARLMAVAA